MEKHIIILRELIEELKKDLKAEHLVHNVVPKNQPLVDKIIARKKSQIEALEAVIKQIEK